MARNKYPEVTVKRILDSAEKLFLEKGYDHTTIQNIIDDLGDLSKGAIYHHFKSKEDIVEAVLNRLYGGMECRIDGVKKAEGKNGLEKLQRTILISLDDPTQEQVMKSAPNLLKDPRFLAGQIQESLEQTAPNVVEPLIREGMADGSIHTQYPKELAEVMMLLANIWFNPAASEAGKEELRNKYLFFKEFGEKMGLPVLNQTVYEKVEKFREFLELSREKKE